MNPVLPCPLFLSLSVDDRDIVDCIIETSFTKNQSSNYLSKVNLLNCICAHAHCIRARRHNIACLTGSTCSASQTSQKSVYTRI